MDTPVKGLPTYLTYPHLSFFLSFLPSFFSPEPLPSLPCLPQIANNEYLLNTTPHPTQTGKRSVPFTHTHTHTHTSTDFFQIKSNQEKATPRNPGIRPRAGPGFRGFGNGGVVELCMDEGMNQGMKG